MLILLHRFRRLKRVRDLYNLTLEISSFFEINLILRLIENMKVSFDIQKY